MKKYFVSCWQSLYLVIRVWDFFKNLNFVRFSILCSFSDNFELFSCSIWPFLIKISIIFSSINFWQNPRPWSLDIGVAYMIQNIFLPIDEYFVPFSSARFLGRLSFKRTPRARFPWKPNFLQTIYTQIYGIHDMIAFVQKIGFFWSNNHFSFYLSKG